MGLGPNQTRLATRIRITGLAEIEGLDKWAQDKQVERTTARAMGAARRLTGKKVHGLPGGSAYQKKRDHSWSQIAAHASANALAQRLGLPKVAKPPKPRKHKHHCLCQFPINEECCRCLPRACLKPKRGTKAKSKGKSTESGTLISGSIVSSAEKKSQPDGNAGPVNVKL